MADKNFALIGLGFLGRELLKDTSIRWHLEAKHKADYPDYPGLPADVKRIVYTKPPFEGYQYELHSLLEAGNAEEFVLISSTGVYDNDAGKISEKSASRFLADNERAKKRLQHENEVAKLVRTTLPHCRFTALRSGGIYGYDRGMLRVAVLVALGAAGPATLAMFASNRFVARIHVKDLAALSVCPEVAAEQIVNGVEPAPVSQHDLVAKIFKTLNQEDGLWDRYYEMVAANDYVTSKVKLPAAGEFRAFMTAFFIDAMDKTNHPPHGKLIQSDFSWIDFSYKNAYNGIMAHLKAE